MRTHEISIYGQQNADGWFCKGCGWQMSGNMELTREEARERHDKESPYPKSESALKAVRNRHGMSDDDSTICKDCGRPWPCPTELTFST